MRALGAVILAVQKQERKVRNVDMDIVVRVAGHQLHALTGGVPEIKVAAGSNLAVCLDNLENQFPGIKESLCDEKGAIRGSINIYVNGDNVRLLQDLATTLKAGDEIDILPAFAGG